LSITETLLIFVGVPTLIVLVIVGLVFAGGARRNRRYRPGRPFSFTPVWLLSAPNQLRPEAVTAAALTAGKHRLALAGDEGARAEAAAERAGRTGGTSDRW
jgi:hypothetical protein